MNIPDGLGTQAGTGFLILDHPAAGPQVLVQFLEPQAGQLLQGNVTDVGNQVLLQEVGILFLGGLTKKMYSPRSFSESCSHATGILTYATEKNLGQISI